MSTQSSLQPLVEELVKSVQGDPFWENYFDQFVSQADCSFGLHLAILVEPYLQFILDGKKTIESRFSVNRCPPYKHIYKGDIILLKRSGGPIVGVCVAADTWFYHLDPQSWTMIKEKFSAAICAQGPDFWSAREAAAFATLIRIKQVKSIAPIHYVKRDRRGWIVLQPVQLQLSFEKI